MNALQLTPIEAVQHLQPAVWAKVNRHVVSKAITELAHEVLFTPELVTSDSGDYRLAADHAGVEYHFRARSLALDHLLIEEASLRRVADGRETDVDAARFILDQRARLRIPEHVLPSYLEELAATLYGAAFKHVNERFDAEQLLHADFQEVESAMTEGHPSFIANNGRLGFNARDYQGYAPEVGGSLRLVWLAARRERSEFSCSHTLSYERLMLQELGPALLAEFVRRLRERGLALENYYLIPVHPWQWENRVAQLFAMDLAEGDLVHLGSGPDDYRAQQSIRTLFNLSHPERCYVKTALSILNMGFTRGLSTGIVQNAASVNDWVARLVHGDACLQRCGFGVLRELAFVGYRHRYYERACRQRVDPYKEMLAALWRESPLTNLQPGERIISMTALMHRDRSGASHLCALIRAAGVGIDAWLRAYLGCYLRPLLHCFYAHQLVFTPHAENVLLVLRDEVPCRLLIKDIAEDIGVLNPRRELDRAVRHLALKVPEDVMTLAIFTDAFDCVFRYLAAILLEGAGYPEQKFWAAVADCVLEYQAEHPEHAAEFRRYDLFAPQFARNCLNRLQLLNNRLMVDLNAPEPVDSLQFFGVLQNPIAPFRRDLQPVRGR